MKFRPLLALLVSLSATAGDERIAYTCADGSVNGSRIDISFSADASGRPLATLHFADETVVLPQVPAASGELFRSGDIRLAIRDDEAVFEDARKNLRRCKRGNVAPVLPQAAASAPQPATTSSFIEISGSVTTLARIALPPNAILKVRIQNGKLTLADQRYVLNGAQVPIPFSATIDRDLLGRKATPTVSARIEAGGELLFAGNKVYPVMKNKLPQPVNITLKAAGHEHAR